MFISKTDPLMLINIPLKDASYKKEDTLFIVKTDQICITFESIEEVSTFLSKATMELYNNSYASIPRLNPNSINSEPVHSVKKRMNTKVNHPSGCCDECDYDLAQKKYAGKMRWYWAGKYKNMPIKPKPPKTSKSPAYLS